MVVPILIALGYIIIALWALIAIRLVIALRVIRPLSRILGEESRRDADGRLISVVVTARDEADQIETTVRKLLQQRHPDLEIVVVDDRSTDGTGAILDRLRLELPQGAVRFQVIHLRSLPDGWIGKCHACHIGAEQSAGDWILFTDGDVSIEDPDLLAGVVAHAERERIDHIAVLPDLRPMTPFQAGLVAVFGQVFMLGARLDEMKRDLPRGGGGIGAFNLVRRSAYERVGGHRLLRMDLVDDYKLGQILKESGARQRFFSGADLIRCAWHRGARNVIRGLEKNFFSGFRFSIAYLTAATSMLALLTFGPAIIGLIVTVLAADSPSAFLVTAAWIPLGLQILAMLSGHLLEARRYGYSPLLLTLCHPISIALLIIAAWNSALTTLRQGGVHWRDTFYPLAALRSGLVRPGTGRQFLGKKG